MGKLLGRKFRAHLTSFSNLNFIFIRLKGLMRFLCVENVE